MTEVLVFSSNDIYDKVRTFCLIRDLTEKIAAREVITRASQTADITITADELQQAVNSWRSRNGLDSVKATQLWLKEHYLSLEELGKLISAEVLSTKLAWHLFQDKVSSYFFDYQLDYVQVSMYEIVLDNEGIAMEVFYAIDEEEINFFDAAYRYVQDTELCRKGGYRGFLYRKDLKPEISAAVFAANPPQLLKPIVASDGVHLIRVEEIVEPQLDDAMREKIVEDLFDDWLSQKVKQFEIKIKD